MVFGQSQRKVKNYIKSAGLSKGYYLHIFAGGVAFLGILLTYASRLLNEINIVVATIPDATMSAEIQDRLFMIAVIFFVSFLAFMASTIFYMIVLGQRVGGPVIALCAVIDELKKGNYDIKRELRKNDELVPVMTSLKELAQVLKEKKS
jgi:nitrogen fixation/metabolism regulation signal transduction histidine kinase